MPRNDSFSAVLDVEPHALHEPAAPVSEDPFNILVIAAFSGANTKDGGLPIEIDRDNFDAVLARISPEAHLRIAGAPLTLRFREMDDFHPDAIHRRMELFREIERATAGRTRASQAASGASGNLLDQMLEISSAEEAPASAAGDLRSFIDRALSHYLVPGETPEAAASRERAHLAKSELMRAILHAPEFQKLEAAWRGLDSLVRRTDTGPNLKIFIADAPGDSWLERDIPAAPRDLEWSVIVFDRSFGRSESDIAVLSHLGARAMARKAVLLAEAEPPDGDASASGRWTAMRRRAEAAHIGLALPRFMARLPYGESGETTDEFPFEEMPLKPRHSDYLWSNPAFACACLLAEAFERDGWRMVPGSVRELQRLPLHVYKDDLESIAKPCAELLLTETDVEELLDEGIMPLVSVRDTDTVRLVRFQSIADPARALAGRWE